MRVITKGKIALNRNKSFGGTHDVCSNSCTAPAGGTCVSTPHHRGPRDAHLNSKPGT